MLSSIPHDCLASDVLVYPTSSTVSSHEVPERTARTTSAGSGPLWPCLAWSTAHAHPRTHRRFRRLNIPGMGTVRLGALDLLPLAPVPHTGPIRTGGGAILLLSQAVKQRTAVGTALNAVDCLMHQDLGEHKEEGITGGCLKVAYRAPGAGGLPVADPHRSWLPRPAREHAWHACVLQHLLTRSLYDADLGIRHGKVLIPENRAGGMREIYTHRGTGFQPEPQPHIPGQVLIDASLALGVRKALRGAMDQKRHQLVLQGVPGGVVKCHQIELHEAQHELQPRYLGCDGHTRPPQDYVMNTSQFFYDNHY